MKLIAGLLTGMLAGFITVLRVRARQEQVLEQRSVGQAVRDIDLLNVFLTVLVWAAGLFLLSLVMPDSLAQMAQEFIGWCLAGTVAALALLATVKGLEGLLDS